MNTRSVYNTNFIISRNCHFTYTVLFYNAQFPKKGKSQRQTSGLSPLPLVFSSPMFHSPLPAIKEYWAMFENDGTFVWEIESRKCWWTLKLPKSVTLGSYLVNLKNEIHRPQRVNFRKFIVDSYVGDWVEKNKYTVWGLEVIHMADKKTWGGEKLWSKTVEKEWC